MAFDMGALIEIRFLPDERHHILGRVPKKRFKRKKKVGYLMEVSDIGNALRIEPRALPRRDPMKISGLMEQPDHCSLIVSYSILLSADPCYPGGCEQTQESECHA
jgi:hypothetical protein